MSKTSYIALERKRKSNTKFLKVIIVKHCIFKYIGYLKRMNSIIIFIDTKNK